MDSGYGGGRRGEVLAGQPVRVVRIALTETVHAQWPGHIPPVIGLSRTVEHGVVTDSSPPAAEFIADGDEFEGGATVGAGE